MAYGDTAPALNGITLPRPSAIAESPELTGSEIVLASGAVRRESPGTRFTVSLSWRKLTESEVATIRSVAGVGSTLSYVHTSGAAYVVFADAPLAVVPQAGTYPVRFDAELTLSEATPALAL